MNGGAYIETEGMAPVARSTVTPTGLLAMPRKLVTTSRKSKRRPPRRCVSFSVTTLAELGSCARAAEMDTWLSHEAGGALQMYLSGCAPPPMLSAPSSVRVALAQLEHACVADVQATFEEQVCVAVQRRAAVADVRSTRRTRSASLVSIFVVYICACNVHLASFVLLVWRC